ncbi:MAG TPA: carboxypeptidase-like regulatory domain-containing protein [Gemmatimonadaceae bacterium]|nr:carboxypeptidase-like regulatory domain-containing protein [Gemmatimonadaceae bacterium]
MLFLTLTIGFRAEIPARVFGVAVGQAPSIAGHVADTIGQPVPGVSITATPQTGGSARRATSGRDGAYQFEALPDGTYRVDFELQGFDLTRRNNVHVRREAKAEADATLSISPICECVISTPRTALRERAGQVVDESRRGLPYARLELLSATGPEVAYADGEGRFRVRLPLNEHWPLTASDSGFGAVTQQVSGIVSQPVVLTLPRAGTEGLPDTERLSRGCRCPGNLFPHTGR